MDRTGVSKRANGASVGHDVSRRSSSANLQTVDKSIGGIEMPSSNGQLPATDTLPLLNDEEQQSRNAGSPLPTWPSAIVYVWLLTLVGGIGGLLFGYDTGVISGALPYLQDDLLANNEAQISRDWIQGLIVSAAVVAAAVGSAMGGALSDAIGRKRALLAGDGLFAAGAIAMAAAPSVSALILGRALVGLGVGLASVTVPAYIAESAPATLRATLVTVNVLMITSGQFVAYLADYLFTFVPGTWRWMLGAAAVPAVLQGLGLLFLPESPRWLLSKGRQEEGREALRKVLNADEAAKEAADITAQIERDRQARIGWWQAVRTPELHAQLSIGVGLQVLQQAAGINTIMYFTPAILELAGVHDKRTALLVATAPAAVNALGTVVGMITIDRHGRRQLLLASLAGVMAALILLGGAFRLSELHSPPVLVPGAGGSCPAAAMVHDCTQCIRQGCDFCGPQQEAMSAGACVARGDQCPPSGPPSYIYSAGCPSPYMPLIVAGLMIYLAAFSPGLSPVPWAVNAEIFPTQLRGFGSGAAATANWLTNALVSQTFLAMTHALGASGTFWLYAVVALCGAVWVYFTLMETKGLSLEEVQELFRAKVRRRGTFGAAASEIGHSGA